MSRYGLPAPPALPELDARFVGVKTYQRDQSDCGSVSCQKWGEVNVYCKLGGSLLIYRQDEQTFKGFSMRSGTFHIGSQGDWIYGPEDRCSPFIADLSAALSEDRFYRLVHAREVAPDVEGVSDHHLLLWRGDALFVRAYTHRDILARVPLNDAFWPAAQMESWATADPEVLRAALAGQAGRRALGQALTRLHQTHKEAFWACVSCERGNVSALREALWALRRFQLLGWCYAAERCGQLWRLVPQGEQEGAPLRCVEPIPYSRSTKPSVDKALLGLVNSLLEAMDARFHWCNFLDVEPDDTTHLLRSAPPQFVVELPEDDALFEPPTWMQLPITWWTAHENMNAVCTWNDLVAQLDLPSVTRFQPPVEVPAAGR